uniref:Uncharacterized protein n=1 Tax=Panagrolaimus sp. ES5 TaxID=591445 RepID=A0AC34GX64_9BILA
MNTSSRAIKKKNLAASSSPVAASSSAYSFRERPTKKDLAKSKSSVYPKVQNLEKAPTESSSPMMNPRNGDTGNKNPERDVNASASSSRERPKEDDLSIYRLRKLQNRETSSNSKTPVTSTTHHGRPVVATSSSVVNSENNGTVKKKRGRPPGVSSSTYSSRKRPLQKDLSKSGSSRKKAPTVSSSLFNSSNNGTVKKMRGRPAAATISSSYSLRQRSKINVTAKSKKNDSSNQERDTVSE